MNFGSDLEERSESHNGMNAISPDEILREAHEEIAITTSEEMMDPSNDWANLQLPEERSTLKYEESAEISEIKQICGVKEKKSNDKKGWAFDLHQERKVFR